MPFRPDLVDGSNAMHGGTISSLLDLTGALSAWSGHDVNNGMRGVTVSMTVNYLSAANSCDIIAEAKAMKRGKELIFCEVTISEEASSKLVSNGTIIYRIT